MPVPHPSKAACARDWLDQEVIRELFEMFGNPAPIERTVHLAVPDCAKLLDRQKQLGADLDKLNKSREPHILSLVVKDVVSAEQARAATRRISRSASR